MIRPNDPNTIRHSMRFRTAGVVTASLTALALTACGSGSGQASNGPGQHSTLASPLSVGGAAAAAPGTEAARYGAKSSQGQAPQAAEHVASKAARAPSRAFFARSLRATQSEESTPTTQKIINPCALVTRGEAQSILGATVLAPRQAPLGPTCIYQTGSHRAFVTLAVELSSFAKLPRQQSSLRKFSGVGRPAYCGGTTGATGLFVRLGANEVLTVTGPCQTGGRFAAHALARLGTVKGVPVKAP
jgi:hypothetical protein